MGNWLILLGVLGIVGLVGSWLWPYAKNWFGLSATTSATADKILAFADEAAFLAALAPAYLLAVKRGDAKIRDLLNQCRLQSATWDDAPPAETATTAAVIQKLEAELSELKAGKA